MKFKLTQILKVILGSQVSLFASTFVQYWKDHRINSQGIKSAWNFALTTHSEAYCLSVWKHILEYNYLQVVQDL